MMVEPSFFAGGDDDGMDINCERVELVKEVSYKVKVNIIVNRQLKLRRELRCCGDCIVVSTVLFVMI
jgi:hypothetical protein